jgi:hypothetical protein
MCTRQLLVAGYLVLGLQWCSPPAPQQPKLVDVRLVGNRLCGTLTTGGVQFNYPGCPPLPTTENTAWQLTPAVTQSIANPARQHLNRIAVLTVSGPSLTEIDVELVRLNGAPNRLLRQVDSARPGGPGEVGSVGEVAASASDDGTTRTWTIAANVSPCADFRHLAIFNRSGGARSTSPLDVVLLRDPADEECGWASGPIYGSSVAGSAGPGDPAKPKPQGPCPGGTPERIFDVCERCGGVGGIPVYTGFSACSWSDVLAVFNKPTCVQSQESRAACEGAP